MLKQTVFLFAVIMSLLIIAFICGCDDDRPNGPEEPKDYPVYFCDPAGNPPKLFTFYPIARRVDSTIISWRPDIGIKVSADGKRLYIDNDHNYYVVNAAELSVITELPGYVFNVSPDNKLIAISSNGINILRTSDYSVVFKDSILPRQSCIFSYDSKSFYCNAPDTVYKIDLSDSTFPITKIDITTEGGIVHVIPSNDGTKLFLNVSINTSIWAFEVYDVLADSITFRDYLIPGHGRMAISPDGKYIFYTNPGAPYTDPPPLMGFKIFDIEANQIDKVVENDSFFTGPNWGAPPNLPVVTPDSHWLVMLGGPFNLMILYLYDIQKGELVHREDWGEVGDGSHFFTSSLAVQYFK